MTSRIIIFSLLCCAIFSCKEKSLEITSENIVGVWHAEHFESKIPDMKPEFAEAGEKEFLSSVYSLNQDMSMQLHSDYFTENASGHWELNPETKEISMFYEYDTIRGIEKYIVKSLTTHEIVLHQDVEPVQGFVELTLKK